MSQATALENNAIAQLASAVGMESTYTDIWGNVHELSEVTRKALLAAMQLPCQDYDQANESLKALEAERYNPTLQPVYVLTQAELNHQLWVNLSPDQLTQTLLWEVHLEEGQQPITGTWLPQHAPENHDPIAQNYGKTIKALNSLPSDLAWGYHELLLKTETNTLLGTTKLIITPNSCYLPEAIEKDHKKFWGPAIQLYALKTLHNWGMGDLNDLDKMIDFTANHEGQLVGLNPLHQLFPHNKYAISPYSPSSQQGFNVWYLSPQWMAERQLASDILDSFNSPDFQAELQQWRDTRIVDYQAVLPLKMTAFKQLFEHFKTHHLAPNTNLAQAFHHFVNESGKSLKNLALYEALQAHFQEQDNNIWGWQVWPKGYETPEAEAVITFAKTHADKVDFYLYLQWHMESHLLELSEKTKHKGLQIGLYLDLAVGVDRAGAQTWSNQSLYADGARVGCPPDALNQLGQDWGLPPVKPHALRNEGYQLFIDTLKRNMRYAGALRLDHVMGLYRLFWIPPEQDARSGAYIYYPYLDLIKLIALESHRNQCIVIGEDLGTVAPQMQQAMADWKLLSYKVLFFEKNAPSQFKTPEEYPETALVTLGTHDLPTIKGFWDEHDIQLRVDLNLYPNEDSKKAQQAERLVDKKAFIEMLKSYDLIDPKTPDNAPLTQEIIIGLEQLCAKTPCYLQLVQIEDILEQPEQMNVPGTTNEHPNWRQKIHLPLQDWYYDDRFTRISKALNTLRN